MPRKDVKGHVAETPEGREGQLVSLAFDLAEKKLKDGSASSQVICQFLKLGTVQNELEKERLMHENELLRAKTDAIKSQQRSDEMYSKALSAMRSYSGLDDDEGDYDEGDSYDY